MRRFNGVASEYISNYLYWFKWLRIFESDKDSIKTKNFMSPKETCCYIYAYNFSRFAYLSHLSNDFLLLYTAEFVKSVKVLLQSLQIYLCLPFFDINSELQ